MIPQMPGKGSANKKANNEPEEIPDVENGDHVYFRHPDGDPRSGVVSAHGKHGCHVDCEGRRFKVKWEGILGHKMRLRPEYRVVDDGEDGMIVQEAGGRRRYIHDPDNAGASDVKKAMPMQLLFGAVPDDIFKALKNGPGLSLQPVTDKKGVPTKRWKRNGPKPTGGDKPGGGDAEAGAAAGYGTHNIVKGAKVKFTIGTMSGQGEVVRTGRKGAAVWDGKRIHKVGWHEISGHQPSPGADEAGKPKDGDKPSVRGEQKPIPGGHFKAADYAAQHDDPDVSEEEILSHFAPDAKKKIADAQNNLKSVEETISTFKDKNGYKKERNEVHRKVLSEFLSPEKVRAATPAPGEAPSLVVLGGRGGSGKGWFTDKKDANAPIVDPDKYIVVDADKVKEMLPEYEGWNAAQVHEESSDLVDLIVSQAKAKGLNICIDSTMKNGDKAVEKVKSFKEAGYHVTAHYMHLPRQEAAKRAVSRFLGEKGRHVPVGVVLDNKTNENTFDRVREHADRWSFRDNNVPRGQEPILISEGGKMATGNENDEN